MLNATQLVAEYGPYYRAGAIPEFMLEPFYEVSPWMMLFKRVDTNNTVLDSQAFKVSSRFQKFSLDFLPIGDMKFVPNKIPLYRIELADRVSPDQIAGTANDWLVQKGLQRQGAPVLAIYQKWALEDAMYRFHANESYKGVDAPTTAGVSSAEGALIHGIKEQIRLQKLTALGITKPTTLLNLPAFPATDNVLLVDYVEAYYDALPDQIKTRTKYIACSKTVLTRFRDGKRKKYTGGYYNQLGGERVSFNAKNSEELVDRDCTLVGSFDMNGSNKLWSTIEGNAVVGYKNESNSGAWNTGVNEGGKTVWMQTDFYIGFGFYNWEWVYETPEN